MNVLITGVAGFIGSRFAGWLQDNVPDVRIVGVDDLSCGYAENVPPGVEWHVMQLGVGDKHLLRLFASKHFDYVFHFAAYAAECLSPFIRRYNYQNNLVATAEIVNACIAAGTVKRLVFTSSIAVYGSGRPPFREDHQSRPIDPYGVAKLACEQDIAIAGEQHGLDWCVLRPHNVYGPGQSIWQRYRNVFGLWMSRRLAGLPLQIYGDGLQQRAFSYIDDCLPVIWRAATEPAAGRQVFNIGGTEPTTIREAAELCRSVMGGGEVEHCEPRHEVRQAWADATKAVDLLGYVDRTPLYDGLRAMWEWAKPAWRMFPERRDSDRIEPEIQQGLYGYWQQPATAQRTAAPLCTATAGHQDAGA